MSNGMNRKTLTLAVLLAATPSMAFAASVYKWTDEDGVTHFGDRQPTGQQAESVNIRTGKSSGGNRMSPQEQLEQLETQEAKESEKRQESAVEEARRKQREANCETARTNLKLIQQNSRIRIEEEGELRYLTPEEIEEQKQQFEKIAEENCGEPAEG